MMTARWSTRQQNAARKVSLKKGCASHSVLALFGGIGHSSCRCRMERSYPYYGRAVLRDSWRRVRGRLILPQQLSPAPQSCSARSNVPPTPLPTSAPNACTPSASASAPQPWAISPPPTASAGRQRGRSTPNAVPKLRARVLLGLRENSPSRTGGQPAALDRVVEQHHARWLGLRHAPGSPRRSPCRPGHADW